jgi:hypothetical protein
MFTRQLSRRLLLLILIVLSFVLSGCHTYSQKEMRDSFAESVKIEVADMKDICSVRAPGMPQRLHKTYLLYSHSSGLLYVINQYVKVAHYGNTIDTTYTTYVNALDPRTGKWKWDNSLHVTGRLHDFALSPDGKKLVFLGLVGIIKGCINSGNFRLIVVDCGKQIPSRKTILISPLMNKFVDKDKVDNYSFRLSDCGRYLSFRVYWATDYLVVYPVPGVGPDTKLLRIQGLGTYLKGNQYQKLAWDFSSDIPVLHTCNFYFWTPWLYQSYNLKTGQPIGKSRPLAGVGAPTSVLFYKGKMLMVNSTGNALFILKTDGSTPMISSRPYFITPRSSRFKGVSRQGRFIAVRAESVDFLWGFPALAWIPQTWISLYFRNDWDRKPVLLTLNGHKSEENLLTFCIGNDVLYAVRRGIGGGPIGEEIPYSWAPSGEGPMICRKDLSGITSLKE